jgi:hypothetical protein
MTCAKREEVRLDGCTLWIDTQRFNLHKFGGRLTRIIWGDSLRITLVTGDQLEFEFEYRDGHLYYDAPRRLRNRPLPRAIRLQRICA